MRLTYKDPVYKANEIIAINPYKQHIIFCDSITSWDKLCKYYNIDPSYPENAAAFFTYINDYNLFIIVLLHKKLQYLNHEINHVVIRLLDEIGQGIFHNSSETFCYLSEWLFKIGHEAYGFKTTRPKPRLKTTKTKGI